VGPPPSQRQIIYLYEVAEVPVERIVAELDRMEADVSSHKRKE